MFTRPALSRLLPGILLSTMISILAYRRRSLSRSGIAGAIVTGTTTFGLGGWTWGLSLIFFFISSSLLSHFRAPAKAHTAADKFSKGGQRDIAQVAANGGMATLLALGYGLSSSCPLQLFFRAGYVGALATATADTWATELGVLSPLPPRLITSGKVVAPGTSGGITLLGTGTGTLGALALGLVFWLLELGGKMLASNTHQPTKKEERGQRHVHGDRVGAGVGLRGVGVLVAARWSGMSQAFLPGQKGDDGRPQGPLTCPPDRVLHIRYLFPRQGATPAPTRLPGRSFRSMHVGCKTLNSLPLLALISGFIGNLTDSLLGATFQAMYYCPTCEKETERSIHNCGTRTRPLRGLAWLNNDAVNFMATLCGALTAMGLHLVVMQGTKRS